MSGSHANGVPTEPPRHCPTCGQDLSQYPYYQLQPGPFTRKLLALARLLIPVMTVSFSRGMRLSTFFRLCSRALWMRMS